MLYGACGLAGGKQKIDLSVEKINDKIQYLLSPLRNLLKEWFALGYANT